MENNYIYVHGEDLKIFKWLGVNSKQFLPEYYDAGNSRRYVDMYRDDKDKNGHGGFNIMGPSGMVVYGKHAWGLGTSYKTQFAFRNMPQDVADFLYEALDYDIRHDIYFDHPEKDIQFGVVSYMEIALSYAYNFYRYKWESWTGGISVKPIFATTGIYGNVYDVDYYVDNYDTAFVYNANFEMGYATPLSYEDNSYPNPPLFKGYGVAFDLGITYQKATLGHGRPYKGRLCGQRYEPYNLKLALAILDLGFISYTRNSRDFAYVDGNADWDRSTDTLAQETLGDIEAKIYSYFAGGSLPVVTDRFKMSTAPAISFQVDYPINKFSFVNGTVIYGFNLGKTYLQRETVVGVTYRYERSRFEVNVPVSIYDWRWKQPKVGISIRYGNFFIGTDKFSNFLGLNDVTGLDFYMGLRLNLTRNFRMYYTKGNCNPIKDRDLDIFDYRQYRN